MTRSLVAGACGLMMSILLPATSLFAQAPVIDQQAPIPFEGGQFTITQQEPDGEKVLAYDGQKLASNYDVFFDRIVNIAGVEVALVDVGDGNIDHLCGPPVMIAWKPKGGTIQGITVEQDGCGAPASVTDDVIYFVPYLLPGASKRAMQWLPTDGLTIAGNLTYMPDPGTGWKDVDVSKYEDMIDAFHNEAVYRDAAALLGNDMTVLAASFLAAGGTKTTASGIVYFDGCAPHNCGGNHGFMAVDAANQKLYFARSSGKPVMDAWPPVQSWPAEVKAALDEAFGSAN
ncbi:hypothetical protein [Mesorhizobium sophorae]|uniref:hypothetical protein n=1 Tax=Mesorhizobium sophorae TaxID=1300294 RepID=UPI000BA37AEC|nr:hypothetical protein [Mesorhizobium sophorae]